MITKKKLITKHFGILYFQAVIAECKRSGLGHIEHHPAIDEGDRHKLYSSMHMSPNTPQGLFNKVQFDVRLYFCRRGIENMLSMTKIHLK